MERFDSLGSQRMEINTGKPSRLNNVSIRTTLSAVVAIFVLMLVVGSAVGFVAVRSGNAALEDMARTDVRAARLLNDSTEFFFRAHMTLIRADMLFGGDVSTDGQKATGDARVLLGKSSDAWAAFVKGSGAESRGADGDDAGAAAVQAATQARDALLSKGMQPQLAALDDRDLSTYRDVVIHALPPVLAEYTAAVNRLRQAQQARASDLQEAAQSRLMWLNTLIAVALVAALLFAVFALWLVRRQVMNPIRDAVAHFNRIARGDLSAPVTVQSTNEIGQMFAALKSMQAALATTLRSVRETASSIDVGAHEIAAGNTDLSSRTEQQAASLQQTASSMEQLTATVRQNSDNARQASQLAVNASHIASRGGEVVGQVVNTMHDISTSSGRIGDIISVIEGIAFQTNILALKPAIVAIRKPLARTVPKAAASVTAKATSTFSDKSADRTGGTPTGSKAAHFPLLPAVVEGEWETF